MAGPSRRTHIVRLSPDDPPSERYIDVEVVDAISFTNENGKEMVFNCPAAKAVPYIIDKTGGGHEKEPAKPTRRSHMKRITNSVDPKQQMDIEVLEAVAFNDENGKEWILHMTADDPDAFDETTGTGDDKSTRHTHDEKVSADSKNSKSPFITVERCDILAFRTTNGEEVIIKMPSHDDGKGERADTHITSPVGYDPNNDNGPKPSANKDPHNYIKFIKGKSFFTGADKVAQGPLWWIRKAHSHGSLAYLYIDVNPTSDPNSTVITVQLTGANFPLFTDDFGEGLILNFRDQPLSASEPKGIADTRDPGDGSVRTMDDLQTAYSNWMGVEDGLITPPPGEIFNDHKNFAIFDFSHLKALGLTQAKFTISANVQHTAGAVGVWDIDMCLFAVDKPVSKFHTNRSDDGTVISGGDVSKIAVSFVDKTMSDVNIFGNVFGDLDLNYDTKPPADKIVSAFIGQSRSDIPTNGAIHSWDCQIDLTTGQCTITGEFNPIVPTISW